MKDKILSLRKEGKSYREIQKVLGCSRSLVSYYVNPDGKTKSLQRQNKNRFRRRTHYKNLLGGKCQKCGYKKCLDALQFHHKNPKEKLFEIQSAIWGQVGVSESDILKEVEKCILLCANCHCETHAHNHFE
jgi:5-methylcytosine-specific restriction endonuclease McrA